MKKSIPAVLAALLLALPLASVLADQPPPLTANYYVLDADKYLDKNVSLSVARVNIATLTDKGDGTKSVRAYCVNNTADGGWITLVAKPEILTRVIDLCGTDHHKSLGGYRPHVIQGTFVKDGSKFALRIDK